jgi:hypothetical protein
MIAFKSAALAPKCRGCAAQFGASVSRARRPRHLRAVQLIEQNAKKAAKAPIGSVENRINVPASTGREDR